MTTYEEWRVTGTTEQNAPVKGVVFTPEDAIHPARHPRSTCDWCAANGDLCPAHAKEAEA